MNWHESSYLYIYIYIYIYANTQKSPSLISPSNSQWKCGNGSSYPHYTYRLNLHSAVIIKTSIIIIMPEDEPAARSSFLYKKFNIENTIAHHYFHYYFISREKENILLNKLVTRTQGRKKHFFETDILRLFELKFYLNEP